MKRILTSSLLAAFVAVLAVASGRDGARAVRVRASQSAVGGPGTIGYDPGSPADFFRAFDGTGRSVGNQFDTRNGNPLIPGTISAVTLFPRVGDGDAAVTVFGPASGTVAPVAGVFYASGIVDSTFNVVPITVPVGSSFLVGMYVGSFGGGPDSIGMRSDTTGGQGFHGMQINFDGAGAAATGFQTLEGQNAMIRVTGTVVPVELLRFEVD